MTTGMAQFAQTRSFFPFRIAAMVGSRMRRQLHASQKMSPHARQWCFRSEKVNFESQPWQRVTSASRAQCSFAASVRVSGDTAETKF